MIHTAQCALGTVQKQSPLLGSLGLILEFIYRFPPSGSFKSHLDITSAKITTH